MEYGKYDPKGRSNKLLTELREKNFTFIEFQRAVAKWLLEPDCWNTFHPEKFPLKTDKILEYEAMLPEIKKGLSKKYYDDNPEILAYKDKKLHLFVANEQRVKDLEEFIGVIDNAGDFEKLKAKKKEFERVVTRQGAELGLKRYLSKEREVQEVIKELEGTIV